MTLTPGDTYFYGYADAPHNGHADCNRHNHRYADYHPDRNFYAPAALPIVEQPER